MKIRYSAAFALAGAFSLAPAQAMAQVCSQFNVSASVGDGSTPLAGDNVQVLMNFPCPACNMGTIGLPGSLSFGTTAGTHQVQFTNTSGNYFVVPFQPLGTCTVNQEQGCNDCVGTASASVFATKGNIDGTVTDCSSGAPVSGAQVYAAQGNYRNTDAAGYFTWKIAGTGANHWGLGVSDVNNGTGPGQWTYTVNVVSGQGVSLGSVQAPVTSSQLTTVQLYIKHPNVREPGRCKPRVVPAKGGGPAPHEAPYNAGEPVNVITGNVWFDRTDASVMGDGSSLSLVRSYNSDNRTINGIMGYGWSHNFERRLNLSHPQAAQRVIEFIEADGSRQYYHDRDVDQTYIASYPRSNQHWITAAGGTYTRHLQGGGTETYDSNGKLTQETDPQGRTTTYTYAGALLSTVTSGGRTLTLGYTAFGATNRLTSVTGPGGELLVTYGYGPVSANTYDTLRRVEYPDGTGYVFHYVGVSTRLLAGVADLEGRWIERHEYDGSNRGITSEIADGVEKLIFAYGSDSTTVTDALGNVTTYEWKMVGGLKRVWKVTGPCTGCGGGGSDVQEWTYDNQARVLTYSDAQGGVTTYTYASDTDDNIVSVQFGKPTASPAYSEPATTYEYQNGYLWKVTAPDGAVTEYERNAAGDVTKVKDPLLRETNITYANGRLATITDPRSKTTTMGYDAVTGDLLTVTDPLSHATTFAYDNQGRRTTVTDALNHTTTTVYSAGGRVTQVTNHDGTFTQFKYEKGGRRSEVIDPMGRSTRYQYDLYGRLIAVIDPMGGVTKYAYDMMSSLISLTDAKNQTTSFEYNGQRQVTKTTYPGGAFETFTYDNLSRLTTMTDRKGIVTTYAYDAKGRLISKTFSNDPTNTPPFTYTYDLTGRMLTAQNGTDTLTWTYNAAGELLSEASVKNASTVAYTYDNGGNRLSVSLNGQLFVTYAYDDASRLTSITRGANVFGFAYDNANRRTSMTYPNGVTTAYSYDNLNRLTNLAATHIPSGTPITNFGYQYDAAGNRTQKSTLDFTENYSYDAQYRLTRADRANPGATPPNQWNWNYDAVGNRISAQKDSEATTSSYNEKNQLLSSTGGGKMVWRGTLDEPGSASFNAASASINGQPARMLAGNVFEATLDLPVGANTVTIQAQDGSGNTASKSYSVNVIGVPITYTYDANGNLATKTEGADAWVYTWNAWNQLVSVSKNSVPIATNDYDPLGRRVRSTTASGSTDWTYSETNIVRQTRALVSKLLVHGPGIDEPLSEFDPQGGPSTFFHADGLGTISRQTDATGVATVNLDLDAWGVYQSSSSAVRGFAGREWDVETGLWFNRARYYDPRMGRFISADPIGFFGGLNSYAYVFNNPSNLIDPSGLIGQEFDNERDAVIDALTTIYCMCLTLNVEFAGRVEKHMDGGYYATGPNPGTRNTSDHGPLRPNSMARYHCHGGPNMPGEKQYKTEEYSDQDTGGAQYEKQSSYMLTPAGDVWFFNPNNDKNASKNGKRGWWARRIPFVKPKCNNQPCG